MPVLLSLMYAIKPLACNLKRASAITTKSKNGHFELRVILVVVALSAAVLSFFMLKAKRHTSSIANVVHLLSANPALRLIPMDDARVLIRVKRRAPRAPRIWIDVLPQGNFMPPPEGVNDYTVFDHAYEGNLTSIYKPGKWEKVLKQSLSEKNKKSLF